MSASPRAWLGGIRHGADIRSSPARAERELRRIGRGRGRIVAGPWLSEVGIELLFWIPMLRWFVERYGIEPERVVAISRGGAASWYAGIAGTYLDVHEHFAPAETRDWAAQRIEATGTQKQTRVTDHDRAILERSSERIGSDHALLHPSLMHRLFRTFWPFDSEMCRLATVLDRTSYRPIARPAPLEGLPGEYVAVKAYFNQVFPDSAENRDFLARLLAFLARRTDVVLLSTGLELDDHAEWSAETAARLHSVQQLMTPANNLEIQTRAIAGARAQIGTYGGLTYLGPFLGVPSFSFYSNEDFNPTHRDVIHRAVRDLEAAGAGAGYVTLPAGSAEALAQILA